MDELADGIRRVTLPLPQRPGHVHAYALPGDEGWTVVDTGLGLPDARERWAAELRQLPGPVARVVVTHFHPDHVGAAADVASLTGAPVLQGRLDYEQCSLVWGGEEWSDVLAAWFAGHGVPPEVTGELIGQGALYKPFIRFQTEPGLLEPDEEVAGWTTVAAPGHADGQLMLHRDGVLVVGDHLLDPITPTVGLWPESRPDPLADYLGALEATIALAPRLALPGHGEPIHDPVGRAQALVAHHRERLERTADALGDEPTTAYEVSFPLFGDELDAASRRFAVAETLSHLEHLALNGGAVRSEPAGVVAYTAA